MMHRKFAQAVAVAGLAVLPMLASAQLSGNVALTSNYKFRGQDQDMIGNNDYAKTKGFKPAIQGGFDYAFGESGFYVGNWNSSVNWLQGNSIESDLYGGYKFKAGPFDLDVGALTYIYPGNSIGNTTELYGAGTWADERCGVSGTGWGEFYIRNAVAHDICARVAYRGDTLSVAADEVINKVVPGAGGDGGAIALDRDGNIAMPFNTTGMYRAWIKPDGSRGTAIFRDEK